MSDEIVGMVKTGGVVMGILTAIVAFFKGFQTKGGCNAAHKAHNNEQIMYRELVNEKLSNIKEDVGEMKALFLKQYGGD